MSALSSILRGVQGGEVVFWCPGCDEAHVIKASVWHWDGNVERPTYGVPMLPVPLVREGRSDSIPRRLHARARRADRPTAPVAEPRGQAMTCDRPECRAVREAARALMDDYAKRHRMPVLASALRAALPAPPIITERGTRGCACGKASMDVAHGTHNCTPIRRNENGEIVSPFTLPAPVDPPPQGVPHRGWACPACGRTCYCDGLGHKPGSAPVDPPRPFDPATSPGMTDLMVTPESIAAIAFEPEARCRECGGTGQVGTGTPSGEGGEDFDRCPSCDGTGRAPSTGSTP